MGNKPPAFQAKHVTCVAFVQKRWGTLLAVLVVLEVVGVILLTWRPTVEKSIQHATLQHASGHSYVATLSGTAPRGYRLEGDRQEDSLRSDLVLLQDGVPVGRPHSVHAAIAQEGMGAYSHWHEALYFSTPANTDPRSDGHRYGFRAGATLSSPAREGVFVGLILIGLAAFATFGQVVKASAMQRGLRLAVGAVGKTSAVLGGVRGRVAASLIVFAVASTSIVANWHEYYVAADSRGYLANQFVEPALRPPIFPVWLDLFSDRNLIKRRLTEIADLGDFNRPLLGKTNDPILRAIWAQRVLLLLAFASLAFATTTYLSFPATIIGFSLVAVSVDPAPIERWAVTITILTLGLIAVWPAVALLVRRGVYQSRATEGAADVSTVALLTRIVALVVAVHLFLPQIVKDSFLSTEQQFLLSETLAMSWQLLFAACVLWFIWKRQGVALILAGAFASLGYLTRSASVFLVIMLSALFLLALFYDSRRFVGYVLAASAVTVLIVYAVPISSIVRGQAPAPTAPMLNWGPIAFAVEVAQPGDERWLIDSESKRFLASVLRMREHAGSRREALPDYRALNLGANLYRVAIPAAKEALPHAFSDRADEPLVYASAKDVDGLFGRVAGPILRHRASEYASVIGESASVALGIHPSVRSTRLFESVWHWLALLVLLVLAFRGTQRNVNIGLAAVFLIGMHVVHVGIVSAFDVPVVRYIYATEIFVAVAIVLLVDHHIRAISKAGLKNWRMVGSGGRPVEL